MHAGHHEELAGLTYATAEEWLRGSAKHGAARAETMRDDITTKKEDLGGEACDIDFSGYDTDKLQSTEHTVCFLYAHAGCDGERFKKTDSRSHS
jgi:hypothetical protein